jgi:uncharacterized protein (DUF169 family)
VTNIADYNRIGEDLERILKLRTSPIAVKMLVSEAEIPPGTYRPKKEHNEHFAQCQAFAMSRREKVTVAMLKEDHWCPGALMAYGLVEKPSPYTGYPYKCFEHGKYIGILTAPLKTATFEPDVVIVYSNTAQLRTLLLSIKPDEIDQVNGHFFQPSCAYSVVYPMQTGQYWVVLPDPGEYGRALTGDDEMMSGIPGDKIERLLTNLRKQGKEEPSSAAHNTMMYPDFPQPERYKEMFRNRGLEVKD